MKCLVQSESILINSCGHAEITVWPSFAEGLNDTKHDCKGRSRFCRRRYEESLGDVPHQRFA
ncbi:MAG: hypothetical protein EA381_17180 [Planctomycetaceae bacterium]|nr:MAG: hypothetical protein EA381_17180 [Planctomycetaceae bacterium]